MAYRAGSIAGGLRPTGWRVRVSVDGRVVADGRRRVLMVGIANGSSIGGGTPLVPSARPDDGEADVFVSFATEPLQRLAYGVLLRRGKHTGYDQVSTTCGARVEVAGAPIPVSADGEVTARITHRAWWLQARAWRIAAPAGTTDEYGRIR